MLQIDNCDTKRCTHILATGFNAFGQLRSTDNDDVASFSALDVPLVHSADVLCVSWSTLVLQDGNRIYSRGHQQINHQFVDTNSQLRCIVDHNGLVACIDNAGQLFLVEAQEADNSANGAIVNVQKPMKDRSAFGLIARTDTGKIAVTLRHRLDDQNCHILEFETLASFLKYAAGLESGSSQPDAHHEVPGQPKQLVSNAASFLLLMDNGDVYSWGDPRHRSLARPVTGPDAISADKPGQVDALGGLNITKIAAGGWLGAGLSSDNALYIWGVNSPGKEGTMAIFRDTEPGEVVLVEVQDDGAEPVDIIDVSIGNNHAAIVSSNGRLFVSGENGNGQLGILDPQLFQPDWTQVEISGAAQKVVCGPHSTLVKVRRSTSR